MMLEHIYTAWYPYERHESEAWWKHGQCMDIRVGLFITSMDHETFV